MPNVDNLDIKIKASADAAAKSLDNVISKTDRLSNSLGKLDTKGIQKFSSGMSMLSKGMQGMQGIKMPAFNAVANGIKKFENIDGAKLGQISNSIKPLAESIQAFSSVNFDTKNVTSLVNSITRLSNANVGSLSGFNFGNLGNQIAQMSTALSNAPNVSRNTIQITNAIAKLGATGDVIGGVTAELPRLSSALRTAISEMSKASTVSDDIISFTSAIGQLSSAGARTKTTAANLGYLAKELKNFFVTMQSAPSVNANIISMTSALANLASQGSKVGSSSRGLVSGLNGFTKSSVGARKSAFSLASAFGKFYANWFLLIRAFKGIGKAITLKSDLQEVQNVIDVTFADMKYKIEEFSETSMEKFGISELTSKTIASRFQAMGNSMGFPIDKMSDMSIELTKLSADMASFYNTDAEDMAKSLQAIFTGETEPLRKFGLNLDLASIKAWALQNGLNANVNTMTQAEKTLLRYQYVLANTSDAQGDVARTIDSWANRVKLLRQQLQALGTIIGEVFINALKPALRALNGFMTSVIKIARTIADALGAIFGWTIETSDTGVIDDMSTSAGDMADGFGDAADNAKKLNKQLAGIDELNVLNTNDSSSSSGSSGSGAGTSGSGSAIQLKQTESVLSKYTSSIKDLEQLGSYIGTTITNSLASINWDNVYASAKNFGSGLASFLNGLISPELFGQVGTTIAGALNTVLYSLNSFGTTFDWTNFGMSIATGINDFFDEFDFKNLADTIDVWVQGVWSTLTTAINGIEWEDVWEDFKTLVSSIDLETIEIVLGAFTLKYLTATGISAVKTLLASEVATGIGSLSVSLTTALSLSIAVAIAGFEIGNWLYDHVPTVTEFSDAMGEWIFEDEDLIITKTISLTLGSLAIALTASQITQIPTLIGSALTAALAGKTISLGKVALGLSLGAATVALSNSEDDLTRIVGSAITGGLATYTFTGSVSASLVIAAAIAGFEGGISLGQKIDEWLTGEESKLTPKEIKADIFLSITDGSWKEAIRLMKEDFEKEHPVLSVTAKLSAPSFEPIKTAFENFKKTWDTINKIDVKADFPDFIKGVETAWNALVEWWEDEHPVLSAITFNAPDDKSVESYATNISSAIVEKWKTKHPILSSVLPSEPADEETEKYTGSISTAITSWWKKKKPNLSTSVKPSVKAMSGTSKKNLKNYKTEVNNTFTGKNGVTKTLENFGKGVKEAFDALNPSLKLTSDYLSEIAKNANASSIIDTRKGAEQKTDATTYQNVIKPDGKTNVGPKKLTLSQKLDYEKRGYKVYATGGFPEDGWFRANHGEVMGKFDNGQSVVANNRQITDGIANAVYRGNQENNNLIKQEIALMQRQNELLLGILEKETGFSAKDVFKSVQNSANEYYNRTGNPAFSY